MSKGSTPRRFTGWHMTMILVGFFAVVVSVNVLMARLALSTFGGTVVDNSYVASQKFNGWLASADAQTRAGWTQRLELDAARRAVVTLRQGDAPVANAIVTARVLHPLGRAEPMALRFVPQGDGRWQADRALPAGRWIIQLKVESGGVTARFHDEVA